MSVKIENIEWEVKDSNETDGKIIVHPVTDADVVNFTPPTGMTATNVQDAIEEVNTNGGKINDVQLDSTSVVSNKIANFNTVTTNRVDQICAGSGSNSNGLQTMLLNYIYPVGSIYMSVNNTSPQTFLGGTWQQLKDRFLLGAGDTYTNGNTGGEATHTLSTAEIPSHYHATADWDGVAVASSLATSGWYSRAKINMTARAGTTDTPGLNTGTAGGGGSHNNMPPYLVVYMWKRTA